MAQIPALISTLKKQLKAHGKTYADVAKVLEISEASVKRLFSEQNFTLQRLEAICHSIDTDLLELSQLTASEQPQLRQLTVEQEQEVISDIKLLMIALNVINGYSFQDLMDELEIDEHQCVQYLAKLDRLKIIELLPGNRIKLMIAPNFRWITNGPIQQFFHEKVEQDFFRSRFDKRHEKLVVLNGLLSNASNAELQKKMSRLAREFNYVMQQDTALPLGEKFGNTMVIAIRHWQFELFQKARKERSS